MLPVSKTLHGVMDMLSEIKTIDIKEIEKKGLKNNIEFVDKDGGRSYIVVNYNENKRQSGRLIINRSDFVYTTTIVS